MKYRGGKSSNYAIPSSKFIPCPCRLGDDSAEGVFMASLVNLDVYTGTCMNHVEKLRADMDGGTN